MGSIGSNFVVGVDGGGSGCRVRVCDADGIQLGAATGGPANFTTHPERTIRNVNDAIARAASSVPLSKDQLRRSVAAVGLAGVLDKADESGLTSALPFLHVVVADDRLTSTIGALGIDDGIVAAIGTGAFLAKRRGPDIRYFGGWGLQVGDQASGAWLGKSALELCLLTHDGINPDSNLVRQLMARFGDNPAEIVSFAAQAQPDDYAALAPLVAASAHEGDTNGRTLMQRGAHYLNKCIKIAGVSASDAICLTGGLGPSYGAYLDEGIAARIRAPEGTALDGALYLARRELQRLETAK